jgi:hypothetical protein
MYIFTILFFLNWKGSTMKTYYQYFHFMSCANSIVKALQEQQNQQSSERQKLYKHRKKCYDAPNKYTGMIIDGMNQKKKNTSTTFCLYTKKITREFHLVSLRWLYGF